MPLAPFDEKAALAAAQEEEPGLDVHHRWSRVPRWVAVGHPRGVGLAVLHHRATSTTRAGRGAGGTGREADEGAQLHHGLVVVSGMGRVEERLGEHPGACPRPVVWRFKEVEPCEDAGDVSIHHRVGQIEGNGEDGRGGVWSNPGDGPGRRRIARESTAGPISHHRGPAAESPGSCVVSEPGPMGQHRLLGGDRERRGSGESSQECGISRPDRFHPRLLEHDLRNPNCPGIAGVAPGEIPPARPIPS